MNKKYIGFTLLELLIVVAIIGILTSIVVATLKDASNKAKNSAVKSNLAIAASALNSAMYVNNQSTQDAVDTTIPILNNPDTQTNSGDEVKSPYDNTLDAYIIGRTAGKGQVAAEVTSNTEITLRGFGKNGSNIEPILTKSIKNSI